jgi:polar amino acid transport system substrate-binding protein
MNILAGLAALFVAATGWAATPLLTISTHNTPEDHKVLEAVSREVFRRVGFDVEIKRLPSERSLLVANSGEIDGEGVRVEGLGSTYGNLIQVPEPYVRISFVAFARKENAIAVDSGWASLRPRRVAFITGWKMFEANASVARSVTKVNSPEQLFRMLDADCVDLALYTRVGGTALAQDLGLTSIVALAPSLHDVDMYL